MTKIIVGSGIRWRKSDESKRQKAAERRGSKQAWGKFGVTATACLVAVAVERRRSPEMHSVAAMASRKPAAEQQPVEVSAASSAWSQVRQCCLLNKSA